jgi:hypothetical protein
LSSLYELGEGGYEYGDKERKEGKLGQGEGRRRRRSEKGEGRATGGEQEMGMRIDIKYQNGLPSKG